MKKLFGLFLLFSPLLMNTAHSAEIRGKAAEEIIVKGKILSVDYYRGDYSLLLIYKKRVYSCKSFFVGTESK